MYSQLIGNGGGQAGSLRARMCVYKKYMYACPNNATNARCTRGGVGEGRV